MIDFSALLVTDKGQTAHRIEVIRADAFETWLAAQPENIRSTVAAHRFTAKAGEFVILPAEPGGLWSAVAGAADSPGLWDGAALASRLPGGTFRITGEMAPNAALGWLLAHYKFDRYLSEAEPSPARILLSPDPASISQTIRLASATTLVRDLINTPAADMGPADIEESARLVAIANGAELRVTRGNELRANYPLIHAVGRAADKHHAPRLIEFEWGKADAPRVAIIGKGISFDSGGLNIKPGTSMRWMKKDMGGAAHAIGLGKLIMEARLPVRLHVLIPAAENAISGDAFRPGDIIRSRSGKTVEIDNTDAEGRLVLADAITRAGEDSPALIINFATLTGAARVALGPDLPAMFANDHALARQISDCAVTAGDPVWRLPLWSGYDEMLKSDVADIVNSADGGMAGAITAALFLRKFVPKDVLWAHLDTFAWRSAAKPGRPKGGDALGMRAVFHALEARFPSS